MDGVLTVKELYQLCAAQIRNGNGDKKILISQDDEGNGFHCLFYDFSDIDEATGGEDYLLPFGVDESNKDNFIILG